MTIDVYLDPPTINCRKVLAAFELLQVPHEVKHIDYFKGEQKSDSFAKINPMKTIPAAVDGDLIIFESNAILQYGADLVQPTSAYPQDLKKRAAINSWLLWESNSWFGTCYLYLIENVVQPLMGEKTNQSAIDKEAPNFEKLASVLEAHLSKNKWVGGEDVSIADIAIASPMHLWKASKLPLDKFPHIKKWMTQGIEKLPAWQKTQGAVEKALLPGGS